MFDEMRAFRSRDDGAQAETILARATVNSARALGLQGQAGELCADGWADLIAIPGTPSPAAVNDAIINHVGPVQASMIAGRWIIPPPTS
jgi:cytosine/adenosine deaminase-related metal-dependent hydrolase